MKKARIFNYICAIMSMLHAGACAYFSTNLYITANSLDDIQGIPFEELMLLMPDEYIVSILLLFFTGFIICIFSVITLIFNSLLPKGDYGKVLGIVASSIALAGMILGLFPLLNILVAGGQAILFLIAGFFTGKQKMNQE